MIRIVDTSEVAAPIERVFDLAAGVERWPSILPHYRFVRIEERRPDGGAVVAMSANRPFGPFQWPTWWTSEMWVDRPKWEVRYRHIKGVTKGMDVTWRLHATETGTHIDLIHDWDGPAWPVISHPAAAWVIMPGFVHGIAWRTLAGVRAAAERR